MLRNEIFENIGNQSIYQSSIFMNDILEIMLASLDIRPHYTIEIGTFKGISAIVLAKYSKEVYTFDIREYPEKYGHWEKFNIANIHSYVLRNREEIKAQIETLSFNLHEFNLAFIDAVHTKKEVEADWNIVKFCKRVIFHDADIKEVREFLDEIGATIIDNFAIWRSHDS